MKNESPDKPLIYLEMWKSKKFVEYTAAQWHAYLSPLQITRPDISASRLALMPEQHVADLLNITTDVVKSFKKEKQVIIKGQ